MHFFVTPFLLITIIFLLFKRMLNYFQQINILDSILTISNEMAYTNLW